MADQNDAQLIVQLSQWGTQMGMDEASRAVWADSFDPEKATTDDPNVGRVLMWYETIGTLTKNKLLDTELVLDWVWVSGMWDKVGPAALRAREKAGVKELYENFEALASVGR
jgi:hypothetical protein